MRGVQLVGFWERRDHGIFRVLGEIFVEKVRVTRLVTHHWCVAHIAPYNFGRVAHSRPHIIDVIY